MLKPYKIWTQYQSFIVYAINAESLQDYVPHKIIRSRACFSWYDKIIRFAQKVFIPMRVRKFEYTHLLEVIGQAHQTSNLTQQLNSILLAPHSRYFRYQLCEFLHQLKLGHPLPLSFSRSFDSLTEHMNLLKSPLLQNKMSEITPFIIESLNFQVDNRVRIYSVMLLGLFALAVINKIAYVLCNTEFVEMHYVKTYMEEYIHPLSAAFMYTFKSSDPVTFNIRLISIVMIACILNQISQLGPIKKISDHLKLSIPFIGQLIKYRNAEQTLFTILLCQQLSLDYNVTASLCYEQLSNSDLKNQWQKKQRDTNTPMYINVLFNEIFSFCSLHITSTSKEHISQTLKLTTEEIYRRQRNLFFATTFIISTSIVMMLLWMLMAYYGYSGILRIFRF